MDKYLIIVANLSREDEKKHLQIYGEILKIGRLEKESKIMLVGGESGLENNTSMFPSEMELEADFTLHLANYSAVIQANLCEEAKQPKTIKYFPTKESGHNLNAIKKNMNSRGIEKILKGHIRTRGGRR